MTIRLSILVPLLAIPLLGQVTEPTTDAGAIVRRAFSRQEDFFDQARNYTYLRHEEEKKLNSKGKVTATETADHEITILYGEPYRKLVRKNGRDLDAKQARKEQEKMDSEIAKRSKDPEKRRRQAEKERAERRKTLSEVAEAFDWSLAGEESIAGRPALVLRASPKPGYKPKSAEAKVFTKMSGRIWIDKAETRMVRADAVVNDTISFGWFLVRIKPGFHFTFELTRMDDQVWLPREGRLKGEAKVGGLRTYRMEIATSYSGYRRFQSDSRIVETSAANQQ